jgi:hypothetical protein
LKSERTGLERERTRFKRERLVGSWRRLREERVAGDSGHCVHRQQRWVGGVGSERDERERETERGGGKRVQNLAFISMSKRKYKKHAIKNSTESVNQ